MKRATGWMGDRALVASDDTGGQPRFFGGRMPLKEHFVVSGNWLFRWRSYIPVLFFCIALLSLRHVSPLRNELADKLWALFCLLVSYCGLYVRALTIGYTPSGTSGRNTRRQVAETLNTTGIYSVVRHPLYLGNFLMWFGVSLFARLWWLSALCALMFWVYYERIMFAEEAYLRQKFGEAYTRWAYRTPAFVPSFRNYVKSALPFSWTKVLRREYNGFFAVALCFCAMELTRDYLAGTEVHVDIMWTVVMAIAFSAWLTLRTLKNHTQLLKGRQRNLVLPSEPGI